ncbi:transcriptional regulator GcvA [Schauerella aestuarii]|uniref:transcriptional regulator GcvA n=1 Tax=Schauerella aestuarii TaxID=2511204 RepID=UPI00136D2B96|nr:transcriptional regulator GcvA [Achromobacter aestuarii]MYZ45197.1 transcriptional regulator GcvA [Achromobacter aestuarii]
MDQLPPLNALRAFEAAGRLASVSAAAGELCVTPAAVSRHIRLLEEHLGTRLFHREHRAIVLTDTGKRYLEEVTLLMDGLRRATAAVRRDQRRQQFQIRAPHSIAMRWLLPRLASFHRANPAIDVKINTSLLPPDFEREDLDAGIQMGDGKWKGVASYKMMANELVPVCTPEKARRLTSPADLAHETLLHVLARPDDWFIWLRAAHVDEIDVTRGMKYESSVLAYEAALEGYGVAIAQKALVSKELQDGRLVMPFELSVDLGDSTYYFLLPEQPRRRSPELEIFRRWVVAVAGQ